MKGFWLTPGSIESHNEFGRKRREKIENDFFSITDNPYINLERVFTSDSLNRKVFDYKMAYLMLAEDYEGIASGLARLENLGYKKIVVQVSKKQQWFAECRVQPCLIWGVLKLTHRLK